PPSRQSTYDYDGSDAASEVQPARRAGTRSCVSLTRRVDERMRTRQRGGNGYDSLRHDQMLAPWSDWLQDARATGTFSLSTSMSCASRRVSSSKSSETSSL